MHASNAVGIALEATRAGLSMMATVVPIAPIPYAQQVISLGESILAMVQRVRSNKTDFQQLAKDIRDLVRAAEGSRAQSSHMKENLGNLISLLEEIKDFVLDHTSHNLLHRIISSSMDASKVQEYREQIRQALDLFELKTQISTHENTERILKALEDSGRNVPRRPKVAKIKPLPKFRRLPESRPLPSITSNGANRGLTASSGDYTDLHISFGSSIRPPSTEIDGLAGEDDNRGPHPSTRSAPNEIKHENSDQYSSAQSDPPYFTVPQSTSNRPANAEPSPDARTEVETARSPSGAISTANSALATIDSDGNISNHIIDRVSFIHVAGNRIENHFHSASATESVTPPPIPEDLARYIDKNPRLRPILGVAIVFHDASTVLQISRVLGLEWTEVGAALHPISSYFECLDSPIGFNSDVKPRKILKECLSQRLHSGKYHSLVAQWCLVGQKLDARDMLYASDCWAHHVCNANSSAELYDALKKSWMPLDPVSRTKLQGIIHWLEDNEGAQASELRSTYIEHRSRPPERVQIMGGMRTMSF
ncbi:hypothetical protein B0H19DRAFT_1060474 [Mycena capillaripes]|nr:hypothetical protein B0H19DRAFT_1060474 [Mycena capillaripes]